MSVLTLICCQIHTDLYWSH